MASIIAIAIGVLCASNCSWAQTSGYGPLMPDTNTVRVVDLPNGFHYRILGTAGSPMNDGLYAPMYPASLGVFPVSDSTAWVLRGHDVTSGGPSRKGPFGFRRHLLQGALEDRVYDGGGPRGKASLGGATALLLHLDKLHILEARLRLAGTLHNAVGAETPWSTWLTCEQTTQSADSTHARDHGYCFSIPVTADTALTQPEPLRRLGRFRRGGIAVDRYSGVIYQTEAGSQGRLYRFVPETPGAVDAGRLQVLAHPRAHDTSVKSPRESEPSRLHWVDVRLDDTDRIQLHPGPVRPVVLRDPGPILIRRGVVFFVAREPEAGVRNQLWRYEPVEASSKETPVLRLDRTIGDKTEDVTDATLTRSGDFVFAVTLDGRSELIQLRFDEQTVGAGGTPIARSVFSGGSAFTGLRFVDDETLLVNLPQAGFTLALTGPWAPW